MRMGASIVPVLVDKSVVEEDYLVGNFEEFGESTPSGSSSRVYVLEIYSLDQVPHRLYSFG